MKRRCQLSEKLKNTKIKKTLTDFIRKCESEKPCNSTSNEKLNFLIPVDELNIPLEKTEEAFQNLMTNHFNFFFLVFVFIL